MNHNDLSSKLAQVIEQIPKDVLYDFCCSYAQEHPFRKGTKGYVHFFGAKKRTKRNIHPYQALTDGRPLSRLEIVEASFTLFSLLHRFPYIGRMQLTPVRDQPTSEFLRPFGSKRHPSGCRALVRFTKLSPFG